MTMRTFRIELVRESAESEIALRTAPMTERTCLDMMPSQRQHGPMTSRHEDFVKRLYSEYFALELRKIPETTEPTPDFGVYASGVQIAVLEVKALESTAPFPTAEELARDKLIAGALRPDN